MRSFSLLLFTLCLVSFSIASDPATHSHSHPHPKPEDGTGQVLIAGDNNKPALDVPFSARVHWMRRAISAIPELSGSPCHFGAFGTAIVNHTASPEGELVCIGVNTVAEDGNPVLHGETVAINNCTKVLTDPEGHYKLSAAETLAAWSELSLYTSAEPCPMCATAIRWGGFAECIYATSASSLVKFGWGQLGITSKEVFERSTALPTRTVLIGNLLDNETDALFRWQFNDNVPCPPGCDRNNEEKTCKKVKPQKQREL